MLDAASQGVRRDCLESLSGLESLAVRLAGHRIAVVGGTGFVGTWIAESVAALNDDLGCAVRVELLGRSAEAWSAHHPHLQREDIGVRSVDVRSPFHLAADTTLVLFAAGIADPRTHASDAHRVFQTNVTGLENSLAVAARLELIHRFVNISSGLALGESAGTGSLGEAEIGALDFTRFHNVYAESRRAGESLTAIYASQYRIPSCTARAFTFAGPYQPLDAPWALNNFMRDALSGADIRIHGDGLARRSYLYGSDAAAWALKMLLDGEDGAVYNLGGETPVSHAAVAEMVADLTTPRPKVLSRSQNAAHDAIATSSPPSTRPANASACARPSRPGRPSSVRCSGTRSAWASGEGFALRPEQARQQQFCNACAARGAASAWKRCRASRSSQMPRGRSDTPNLRQTSLFHPPMSPGLLLRRLTWSSSADLLTIAVARAVAIGGQLLYLHLYSSRLSVHELGIYFFLLTASYSFNAIVFVPLDYFQQARLHAVLASDGSLAALLKLNRAVIGRMLWAACAIAVVAAFVSARYAAIFITIFSTSLFMHVTQSLRGVLNNLGYRRLNAVTQIAEVGLKYGLSFVVLTQLAQTAAGLVGALAVSLAVSSVWLYAAARRRGLFRPVPTGMTVFDRATVLRFAYPMSLAAVSNWLQLQGYRFIMVPLGYTEVVGTYATVANLGAAIMNAAASIFGQMFIPEIYRSSGRYTRTYAKHAALVIAVVCVCTLLLSTEVVRLATNGKLTAFAYLIVFGVLTEAGNFLIGALSVHLTLVHESRRLLSASLVGASTMAASFAGLWGFGTVTPATLGLPIVLSQLCSVLYMFHCCRGRAAAVASA